MKRYALLLTACAAALTLSGASYAQPPGGRGPGGFGSGGFGLLQFDTNADGKLTKAEFDAAQRTRFSQIDANKDGSATPEEMRTGMEAQMKVNREAAQKGRFAELDKDKSGQISQSEFLAGIDARRAGGDLPRVEGRGGPGFGPRLAFGLPGGPFGDRGPGDRRGPRPDGAQGPGGPPPQGGEQRAMRAGPGDADGDGKITFAEFTARPNEAFARADANKDGTVTIAELQAMPAGPR